MMAGIRGQQTEGFALEYRARQDRNVVLTDGGTISWAGSTLTWGSAFKLRASGAVAATIAAGSVTISTANRAFYAIVDRDGFAVTSTGVAALNALDWDNSDIFLLAVRGSDGKLYFANGTVFAQNDSKEFGALNAATDRYDETTVSVSVPEVYNLPFDYVIGSHQLVVFMTDSSGTILLQAGEHYEETDTDVVTVTDSALNGGPKSFTFINLAGGQGPAGPAGSLQDGYDNGAGVVITPGSPTQIGAASGASTISLLEFLSGATVKAKVTKGGLVQGTEAGVTDDTNSNKAWKLTPVSGNLVLWHTDGTAVSLSKSTGKLAFGTFNGSAFSGDGFLRHKTFTGTFDSSGPTTVPWSGSTPYGAILAAENSDTGLTHLQELSLGQSSNRAVVLLWDSGESEFILSNSTDGTSAVGAHLQGEAFRLVVFY